MTADASVKPELRANVPDVLTLATELIRAPSVTPIRAARWKSSPAVWRPSGTMWSA